MNWTAHLVSMLVATALIDLLASPKASAGPAPMSPSWWPPIRFDDRKGVVVLQAPVFMPEIRAKGAKFGYVHSQPSYLDEMGGRPDAAAAAQWGGPVDYAAPLRIEPVDRAALTHDSKKCTLFCVYGMQTDVEGVELCKCRDPCREVLCREGERCVPERACSGDGCRYRGYCQAAATTQSTAVVGAERNALCSLGKPRSRSSSNNIAGSQQQPACLNATRRYYYDDRTQRCRKFRGCDSDLSGSFASHRQCSMACERTSRPATSASPASAAAGIRRTAFIAPTRTAPTQTAARLSAETTAPTATSPAATARLRRPASAAAPDRNGVDGLLLQVTRQQRGGGGISRDYLDDQDDGCAFGEVPIPGGKCPYDPCERCSLPGVACRPSRCGQCRAVYYNLRTGFTAVREGGGFC